MKPIIQKLVTLTAMLLSMLTASAYDFEYNGMYFNITSTANLTCAITYRDNNYNTYAGNVTIPSEVEYKGRTLTVTRIQDAFRDCINLTSVTIPNSVPVISGFSNCTSLTSVNIPNSVTEIGGWAFSDCSSLTSVNIPNSVTKIGDSAFSGCSSLTSVNIPNSVTKIGNYAFSHCSSLTVVNIPNSVTTIDHRTFQVCRSLTSVNIPNSVTEIGGWAFSGCSSLTEVSIPNSVECIRAAAFCDCSQLSQVIFEKGEKELTLDKKNDSGEGMFYNDKILTDIVIGRNIRNNDNRYLWYDFRDELNLEYITNLTFLDDVKINNFFAYNDYSGTLVNLTIGKNVGNYPSSLTNYHQLQTITLKEAIPQRCPDFTPSQNAEMIIYIPKGSLSAYQNASGWRNFWDIREGEYSGIEDTAVTPEKPEVGRYDLQGRKVGEDYCGMVIVRFSDGSVKKTIVR